MSEGSNKIQLIERQELEEIVREVVREEIAAALEPLLSAIVLRQKDVHELAGSSPRTVSNKIAKGEVPVLSSDGSRKNYLTLTTVRNLKRRRVDSGRKRA